MKCVQYLYIEDPATPGYKPLPRHSAVPISPPKSWREVHGSENSAEERSRRLLTRLYSGEFDALEILKLKEVADQLEEAADAFEHIANVVETIAVKES